jgi:GNAT superfamily N-acetyltransferase
MKIGSRVALAAEKPAIWRLYESAMMQHIEAIWGWDAGWQAAHFDKAFAASSTWVVEADGRFCGYFQLDAGDAEDYLRMLVLSPDCRSAGIGAVLLARIVGAARQAGRSMYLRVFRTNLAAQRFYEREGWFVAADERDFLVMRRT